MIHVKCITLLYEISNDKSCPSLLGPFLWTSLKVKVMKLKWSKSGCIIELEQV